MNKKTLLGILCFIACSFIQPIAKSDELVEDRVVVEEQPKVAAYSQEPLTYEATTSTIPVDYRGHDVKLIFQNLKEKLREKDEFETTAQYQSRINNSVREPIFGSIRSESLLGIVIDATSTYDADASRSEITFFLAPPPILVGDFNKRADEAVVEFQRTLLKQSTYSATNGYGAKAEILKREWEIYSVFLTGWKRFTFQPKYEFKYVEMNPEGRFVIPMSVEDAKAAKDKLKALITYKLIAPYYKDALDFGAKTTIQHPYDTKYEMHLVCGVVQDIIIFNEKNGQIVFKAPKK